jgi:hypothetical protein
VKASDDDVSTGLQYYTRKLKPQQSFQLVRELDRAREKSGVKVVPLAAWLESLPFA